MQLAKKKLALRQHLSLVGVPNELSEYLDGATQLCSLAVVAGEEPRISSGGCAGAKCKMTLRISAASSYPESMTHILLSPSLYAPAGKFVCSSGSVFVPLFPFLARRLVASEPWFDLAVRLPHLDELARLRIASGMIPLPLRASDGGMLLLSCLPCAA